MPSPMKKIFLALIFAAGLTSATSQNVSKYSEKDLVNLNWLEGTWMRTNTKPGRTSYEYWKRSSTGEMMGYNVLLQGTDTLSFEKMTILSKDNILYFVADIPENKAPVFFQLTSLENLSFTCENPAHDFPKRIVYRRTDDRITATISGHEKSIDYFFKMTSK